MTRAAVVARARGLVGTRFRLHGRDRDGLDCVGLVAAAHGVTDVPTGYRLRSGDAGALAMVAERAGLVPATERAPGDLVLVRAGPGQLHLAIDTGDGLIHADAGLRRVVERPDPAPWPEIGRWRKY